MSWYPVIWTFLAFVLYPLLFWYNTKVRFYSKLLMYYIHLGFGCVLPLPIVIFRPRDPRNINICAYVLNSLSSKMFNITWKVNGLEHVTGEDALVIVSNHQSFLDLIPLMHVWPTFVRASPIAKRELMYFGPFGLMIYLCGTVFLDRTNPDKARMSICEAVRYLTDKKTKLLIYPEGTRNEGETLLPFKKGAFHLALQGQVPIVPMVVSSYSNFYSCSKKKFENGGHATIQFLPPVPTKGLTVNDVDSLVASVRNSMQQTYQTISGFKPDKTVEQEIMTQRNNNLHT